MRGALILLGLQLLLLFVAVTFFKDVGNELRPLFEELRNLIEKKVWDRVLQGEGVSSFQSLILHLQKLFVRSHPHSLFTLGVVRVCCPSYAMF